MFAEIITIADELLIGQELNKMGIEVLRGISIRDREIEIIETIDDAMKRVRIILITGGLEASKEDITKQTLCKYFDLELAFSETVFENIQRVLVGKIPMNALNKNQAMVPKDYIIINNPVGGASVSWLEKEGEIFIFMSGAPQEMTVVMNETVLPRLYETFKIDVILHQTFLVQNYPKTVLVEKLKLWESSLPKCIKLAYLPKLGGIQLRLMAHGQDRLKLEAALDCEIGKLKKIVRKNIFREKDKTLEMMIGELLKKKKWTVSTAESCTGGSIAARLTSIAGSSKYFNGSVVAYSNTIKMDLLNVSSQTLEQHGAVSKETVIEMVKGAMKTMKTDCAIATSGIAGPGGGTPDKPVGTVWIAAGCKKEIRTYKQEVDHGRVLNIERASNNVLYLLLEMLE